MKLYGKANEVAERILKSFEHPESLPAVLAPIFIQRDDDVPCRKWSWQNQLLVALAGSSDARGFRQWVAVNRTVKKGCKAIWILGPCIKAIKEKDEYGVEQQRQVMLGFKSIPVFKVEDTEGEPLPEDNKFQKWIDELPLVEVAKEWGIHVGTYSGENSGALGYYRRGEQQQIMLGVENLSTWTHELLHAADDRLTELKEEHWRKEIVAELGGAILLECMGQHVQSDLHGAYEYIRRHSEASGKDMMRCCMDVLSNTCACVKLILDTAEKTQEAVAIPA